MPQPLSKVKKIKSSVFSAAVFQERPELAIIVMEVIATWSRIDVNLGSLLANFTKSSDKDVIISMYLNLSGGAAKKAALDGAAEAVLSKRHLELYNKTMSQIKASRNRRNDFAHGMWGITPDIPDALLWSASKDEILQFVSVTGIQDLRRKRKKSYEPEVFVYREKDLQADLKNAQDAQSKVFNLLLKLNPKGGRKRVGLIVPPRPKKPS